MTIEELNVLFFLNPFYMDSPAKNREDIEI